MNEFTIIMNNRNTTLHVLFMVMSAMQLYGMHDRDDEQGVTKNIPTLQRLAGQKIVLELERRINVQEQLSNVEFKTILAHKFLFTDLVNDDIYDHDGRIVLKKARLLEKAVRTNHLQMTALLCAVGAQPDKIILDKNETLLHVAADNGNQRIAKLLLKHGVPVDCADCNGETPLYYASERGHRAVVELLLDHGAKVNGDSLNFTPLYYASERGHEAVVKLLLDRGAKVNGNSLILTPLHQASFQGHEAVVELLLDRGAQVNGFSQDGRTPLYYASRQGHRAIVELLLDSGAQVNGFNQFTWPPLHQASCNGHEAVVELLLDRGADVDIKDSSGKTCEYYTKTQSIRDLIAQARIDRKRKTDDNQFHVASCNGYEALVELLLDHDANINCIDTQDRTREHLAESQATGDLIEQESIRRHHDSCCNIS